MSERRPLATIAEVAKYLRCGKSTAYAMAASGELPGVIRLGGLVRVDMTVLEEAIRNQNGHGEAS